MILKTFLELFCFNSLARFFPEVKPLAGNFPCWCLGFWLRLWLLRFGLAL
eukprot:UN00144